MAVSGKEPSVEPFAILVAIVYSAADVFLAAVVARQRAFIELFLPFLVLRSVLNVRLLLISAGSILRIDAAGNAARRKRSALR